MSRRLLSINVGRVQSLDDGRHKLTTAILKRPVDGPVRLENLGLTGDEQADRRHHGGPDKAINVYPSEHYPYWEKKLAAPQRPGAFGENFTTAGLVEEEVAIGDVYRIGSVLVQVTQPRQPCRTLAARHCEPRLARWVEASGKTGFYLRCLQPGELTAGEAIELVERPPQAVTIVEANRTMRDRDDPEAVTRLLAVEALSTAWREELERRRATQS